MEVIMVWVATILRVVWELYVVASSQLELGCWQD